MAWRLYPSHAISAESVRSPWRSNRAIACRHDREGEAPAEPRFSLGTRLGRSLALPIGRTCDCPGQSNGGTHVSMAEKRRPARSENWMGCKRVLKNWPAAGLLGLVQEM